MKLFIGTLLKPALLLAATMTLASCGGSGGGGGGTSSSATITSISVPGMVQATTRNIALTGTNFVNGMTLSLTSSLGTQTVMPTTITSTMIVASVTINTAPAERYVTVNLQSGGSTVASTILGVASSNKTLAGNIMTIFTTNSLCTSCHGGSGNMALDGGTIATAAALINTNSKGCSARLRVTPGDPRRSKSVLIDKILASSTGISPCYGVGMPADANVLTAQQIADIIDWVAGGAN